MHVVFNEPHPPPDEAYVIQKVDLEAAIQFVTTFRRQGDFYQKAVNELESKNAGKSSKAGSSVALRKGAAEPLEKVPKVDDSDIKRAVMMFPGTVPNLKVKENWNAWRGTRHKLCDLLLCRRRVPPPLKKKTLTNVTRPCVTIIYGPAP